MLRPVEEDRVEVFDYLVDTIQRRAGPLAHVPERVVRDVIDFVGPADKDSLADTVYALGATRAPRSLARARRVP